MIRPLRNQILVAPDAIRDDITSMGIIVQARQGIHTSAEQLGLKGTVKAVGPEVDPDQLKPGDRILFGEFQHPEHYVGTQKYLILSEMDVCGIIDG